MELLGRAQRRELEPEELDLSELSRQLRVAVEGGGEQLDLLWAAESLHALTRLMEFKMGRASVEDGDELPSAEELAEPEPDPAARLEEYRLFRAAAEVLLADASAGPKAFLRVLGVPVRPRARISLDPEVLASALGEVLSRLPEATVVELGSMRYSMAEKAAELVALLAQRPVVEFEDLFAAARDRLEAVVLFLALLDLLSRGRIGCHQEGNHGPIRVELSDVG